MVVNSKCCHLFILRFNVPTTVAPGGDVTPNTAMQTAVMWGYVSRSAAVYKYGASAAEYHRYAPPDTPGIGRLLHHSTCEMKRERDVLSEPRGALSFSRYCTFVDICSGRKYWREYYIYLLSVVGSKPVSFTYVNDKLIHHCITRASVLKYHSVPHEALVSKLTNTLSVFLCPTIGVNILNVC